ncbi:MAG: hypothetical protein A2521_05440 [Deltaproteobacteria bacterium RIFOXYD12_FULL_57_12]|nr:MAG: hypothetical protein A2521_05440 [Deltaproteobacteria bacterium RIFOXYD12_FULL_57_12]
MKQQVITTIRRPCFSLCVLLAILLLYAPLARAAISLVGSSTATQKNSFDLTLAVPVGVTTGHVLLAQVILRATDSITAPAGWTLIDSKSSGATLTQAIYYRVATATEPASYAWTSLRNDWAGGMVAYRGVDTAANPINVASGQANGSSTSVTAPTVTTTVSNALLVGFFVTANKNDFSGTAGMAERYRQSYANTTTSLLATDETKAAAGATGTRTATANAADVNIGHLIALKPTIFDHFLVEASAGGTIPAQTSGLPFSIKITAQTVANLTDTGFTGTVNITASGALAAGGGTTAAFVNGVLASHSITIVNLGSYSITATNSAGAQTGTSNAFLVVAGAAAKLQILVPGETAASGTPTGKTGTPTAQDEGVAFTVRVNAVDAFWNVITTRVDTVGLTASDGAAILPANAPLVAGTRTFSITLNTPPSATITASDITAPAITADTSPSIPINAGGGNFNAYETSTGAGAVTGVIKTKVAGTAFTLDIIAIKGGAIDPVYASQVRIELLDSSNNSAALDADGCRSSWATIQTLPLMQFVAGDLGRKAATFTENNAWPDARIKVTSVTGGARRGCSNNNFAIRPASFTGVSVQDSNWQTAGTSRTLNNTAATGGVVHKAGQPFRVNATAVNSAAGITTNYSGTPTANLTACLLPTGCLNGNLGALSIGTAAVSGVLTATNATYSETGAFTMQLEDQTFAAVDAADSTAAERSIISAALNVGRFVPDHFDLTANNTPSFKTFNDTACASRSFTYIGQPFGYATAPQTLVTAKNLANNTTVNYAGNLWKIAAVDVSQVYANAQAAYTTAINPATVTPNNNGTGTVTPAAADTLTFTRDDPTTVTPEIPFNAAISLSVNLADNSETATPGNGVIATTAAFTFNGSGSGIAFDAGSEFRFGRLQLLNGFGPETVPLVLPSSAEYFDSTSTWKTNSADSCTAFLFNSKIETGITVSSIPPATLQLSAGQGRLTLTPATDSGDPGGTVAIDYANIPVWLLPAGSATVEAVFGIYRGNDRIINWREILK